MNELWEYHLLKREHFMKVLIVATSISLVVLGLLMMTVPNFILSEAHYLSTESSIKTLGGLGLVVTGAVLMLFVYFKKPQQ